MSIISRKRKRETGRTSFVSVTTGKTVGWVDVVLSNDDWLQVHALLDIAYNAGLKSGSEDRAKEIRMALGINNDNI